MRTLAFRFADPCPDLAFGDGHQVRSVLVGDMHDPVIGRRMFFWLDVGETDEARIMLHGFQRADLGKPTNGDSLPVFGWSDLMQDAGIVTPDEIMIASCCRRTAT